MKPFFQAMAKLAVFTVYKAHKKNKYLFLRNVLMKVVRPQHGLYKTDDYLDAYKAKPSFQERT